MNSQEIDEKLFRLRRMMVEEKLDGVLLRRVSSFAWLAGGAASYVNMATDIGAAALLVTPQRVTVLTNNIEAPRLEVEEQVAALGFEVQAVPWYAPGLDPAVLAPGGRLGGDGSYPGTVDVSARICRLRAHLLPIEGERFRRLGRLCGEAIGAAAKRVHPGQTEVEIAGILAEETYRRGAVPIVNLIAVDERISAFRHPLPTGRRLERYAMLVLCGRQSGLVASVTRLMHFGPLSAELQRKQDAVAAVDATFLAYTRPGMPLSEIFARAVEAYELQGFPGEWQLHHQGGSAGYEPREYLGTPSSLDVVAAGQAYAWNPSITGVKSEDTILVGESANEILTATPGWPAVHVLTPVGSIARPEILVV